MRSSPQSATNRYTLHHLVIGAELSVTRGARTGRNTGKTRIGWCAFAHHPILRRTICRSYLLTADVEVVEIDGLRDLKRPALAPAVRGIHLDQLPGRGPAVELETAHVTHLHAVHPPLHAPVRGPARVAGHHILHAMPDTTRELRTRHEVRHVEPRPARDGILNRDRRLQRARALPRDFGNELVRAARPEVQRLEDARRMAVPIATDLDPERHVERGP